MLQFNNVMEVFKLLDKSNCRKCNEKTCLAFAAAVYKGKKQINECPVVSDKVASGYGIRKNQADLYQEELENTVKKFGEELSRIDFETAAERIGGVFDGNKLTLKIMGKNFSLDTDGKIYTDIHVNSWVLVSVFRYIINCKGASVEGDWVPFRELAGGRARYRLFAQQCEKPMKRLADKHPDLLADMADLFSDGKVSDQYQSDIAVILSPLPLVPMLICYWKAEDGMASSLNLFFDVTAEGNIGIEGVYILGAGITQMFEKLALQHGRSTG